MPSQWQKFVAPHEIRAMQHARMICHVVSVQTLMRIKFKAFLAVLGNIMQQFYIPKHHFCMFDTPNTLASINMWTKPKQDSNCTAPFQ